MATFYLDFEGGNDSNDGTTFANRWKTITSGATAARTAPGDVIRIMKSPDPVSLGVNGTFTKQSPTITLASAVTANISLCQAAWTASANVTTTTSSTRKEGTLSTSIAPAAAFTTGLLAYEATGTLDLSAYQNVTFWIRTSSAVSANVLRLDLCSDAAGATPVHSITIDTAFGSNIWKPVTWKNGSALSSSIQSVALRALSDPGTPTILIDNIIATNDLHFNSLIGTSSSATNQVWYPIQSINGTTVIMGHDQNQDATVTARGWHDATITTTAYVRDTIRLTAQQSTNEGGSSSSTLITYSGGWDRTNMSTQDGITVFCLDRNTIGASNGAIITNRLYTKYDKLSCLWGYSFNTTTTNNSIISNCGIYGNTFAQSNIDTIWDNLYFISNNHTWTANGVFRNLFFYSNIGFNPSTGNVIENGEFINNNNAITLRGGPYTNITSKDNTTTFGMVCAGNVTINGLISSGHAIGVDIQASLVKINNATLSDSTPIRTTAINYSVFVSRYSTYKGMIHSNGSVVVQDSNAVLHGVASISWKHDPTADHTTTNCVRQPLQPFAVNPSTLLTFSIWVYRTSTDVEGRVRLRGYVTPGVDADVTATITAAINTWQELTVTCTPSAAGVVQIDLESYSVNGSTGTVYFGDATVSQA